MSVLDRVRAELAAVPGVAALALGGSRARGTADATSDYDIGLYYERANRPATAALTAAFRRLDPEAAACTAYGEWGPWINGGGWLTVDGVPVDILLREVDRVRDVLTACAAGRPEMHYQPGHPHGFCTAIYAGEVHHAVPLHDPDGVLAELTARTRPYPAALAAALEQRFGWEAGFALDTAGKAAKRGDLAYVTGCAYRAVACLTQVVFARAGRYLLNEKGAVAEAASFAPGFADAVDHALRAGDPERMIALLRDARAAFG